MNGYRLDLRDAYQRDIGEYDIMMVRYNYTPFAPEKKAAGLDAIVAETRKKGLLFMPGPIRGGFDSRPRHPDRYLRQTMRRKIILTQ